MADPQKSRPVFDQPLTGSILVGGGMPAVIRIPIPGTDRLCLELRPRGYVPPSGSTSTIFFQDITGKRHLRLDYGYNVKTKSIDYHWNQKGTFNDFGVTDHTPAGPAGEALYRGARYYRFGGRVLLIAGAAIDLYSIVFSSEPLRQAVHVAGGWAGAWAGAEGAGAAGAWIGSFAGPEGTAAGGIVFGIVGGAAGYWGGSVVADHVYLWAEHTVFIPVPQVDGPAGGPP